jgi:multidrug transporter EmrE-like cation transporter
MSPTAQNIVLLALNIILTAAAQALLREGMRGIGETAARDGTTLWSHYAEIARNGFVVGGMACFSVSLALWLTLLSRWRISALYPVQQSLVFVLLELAAWRFLGEAMSVSKVVGVVCICVGVYLMARGG